MTQAGITEVIVAGNHTAEEIAEMFNLSQEEVKEMQRENDRQLLDENVSEESYREWCDATDATHGTVAI